MEILHDQVYATQPKPLQKQIETLLSQSTQNPIDEDILALIVPDTNLLRVGPSSANIFKTIAGQDYETVILVSPSHMGSFGRMTICDLKAYQTPLGSIDINTSVCHDGSVTLSTKKDGSSIIIEITDTGIGIAQDYQDELFTPFFQEDGGVNRSFEGAGLGLALVKLLIDLMKGRIEVESEKGIGSTFRIFLPAA